MESLKYLVIFLVIGGLAFAGIKYPDPIYRAYKARFDPDPPPPPPPDMTGYIELKPLPVVEKPDDGPTFYIAGAQDVLGWDETHISAYYTYDGSAEDEKQAVTFELEHGTRIKVLDRITSRGTNWSYIETEEQFKRRGWVTSNYVKYGKPPSKEKKKDFVEAREEAKEKERQAEEDRKRLEREMERARERMNGGG